MTDFTLRPPTHHPDEVPLTVCSVAQRQRAGRYLPAVFALPGKMLSELALRIVAEQPRPGDLIVTSPRCGQSRYGLAVVLSPRRRPHGPCCRGGRFVITQEDPLVFRSVPRPTGGTVGE